MERPPRRWGCWAWLGVLAGMVGLPLLSLVLWARSDGDMVAVERRLQELGLPMTWKELGLPAPTASQRATMDRLRQLEVAAKEYPEGFRWLDPFLPVSLELREWAQLHGSGVDADLDAALDAADGGLWISAETEALDADLANGTWKVKLIDDPRVKLAEVLFARGSALEAAEAPALLARIAHLVRMQNSSRYLEFLASLRIAVRWSSLATRWRSIAPATTASQAYSLADDLDRLLVAASDARLLFLLQCARGEFQSTARWSVMTPPDFMDNPIIPPLARRAGRAPMILRNVEMVRQTRLHGPSRTMEEIDRRAPPEDEQRYRDMLRAPVLVYWMTFDQGWSNTKGRITLLHNLHSANLRITTHLRLLAADLTGQPWPADPCDPDGKLLRPILRDGRVIGAYSFGPDGIDGGGDRKTDWCWPLHESLGTPKAGDPLPVPGEERGMMSAGTGTGTMMGPLGPAMTPRPSITK